jgi:hypothetical protein
VTSPPAGAVCPSFVTALAVKRRGERQVFYMNVAIFAFKSPPYQGGDLGEVEFAFRPACSGAVSVKAGEVEASLHIFFCLNCSQPSCFFSEGNNIF